MKESNLSARDRALLRLKQRSQLPNKEEILKDILSGSSVALSQALTLVESKKRDHQQLAQSLIQDCLPHSGNSFRLGITGVPGAGKSTFIEHFGDVLLEEGKKIAVLAIDPSSQVSGGSILGDKTRMEKLSGNPNVFIRPSPSADSLGGVARKTREAIVLCEAAGYDFIIIETVGVGQSETEVKNMVDCFLLLMLAGAGDELQGIKRGIMEMADAICISKSDGDNERPAQHARQNYKNALHLMPAPDNGWLPPVKTISAFQRPTLEGVLTMLKKYEHHIISNNWKSENRQRQAISWFNKALDNGWLDRLNQSERLKKMLVEKRNAVSANELSPFIAAEEMMDAVFGR